MARTLHQGTVRRRTPRGGSQPQVPARLQRSTVNSFQRPDADYLEYDPIRTPLTGRAGSDINDLSFHQRGDGMNQGAWFQIRDNTPSRRVLEAPRQT